MTTKTRYCDECSNYDERKSRVSENPCGIGHKPRFYRQRVGWSPDWGWKRRCEDFKEKRDDHPAHP